MGAHLDDARIEMVRHDTSGWRRALALALVASLALLGSSCTVPLSAGGPGVTSTTTTTTLPGNPHDAVPPQPASELTWHSCDSTFRCSKLVVPVSYSDRGDGTLSLAVVELPTTGDPKTARDLVMNPGGPGASGVQFLEGSASAFPAALRKEFNLVSFDPRGIGGSDPVECASPPELRRWIGLDPDPSTRAEIALTIAGVKAFDAACARSVPRDVLANLSTAVTARDMDRLRAALGQAKLDYLGFSYGTYLGALYAQAFPGHVGYMVLDGAVDPALSEVATERQQAASFEVDLHDFFAWCPTNVTCAGELPDGAAAAYAEVMGSLEGGHTLAADLSTALGGEQQANYGVVLTGVVSSLYSTNYWPYLAEGLASAAGSHNGTVLTELAYSYAGFNADGTVQNLVSANVAIACLDHPSPPVSNYPSLAREFATTAPDFGPTEAWGTLACNYWPVAPTGKAAPVHLSERLPILVVGSTHDPATPYAWARALTTQLAGAELLTRDGDGHTGYFSSTCVQNWVDRYLSTGARPPSGTVCSSGT
jgi:pimeloyl-ACP methyl ester carboxylesterase